MTATHKVPKTHQEIDRALATMRFVSTAADALHVDRDTAWNLIRTFRLPAASVEIYGDSFVVRTPSGFLGEEG